MAPDSRGVLLGPKGVLVFASLDRLVAFLRAASEDGLLDEIATDLELRYLQTPLKTREVMVSFPSDSSYRMDRAASLARLTGGSLFTGATRHFVRYRDAAGPLGYDVHALLDSAADRILYDATHQQTYTFGRSLDLRDLLVRLSLESAPEISARPGSVFMLTEVGVGQSAIHYLFRSGIAAGVALVEWPPKSSFDERPRRLLLFEVDDLPSRLLRLFGSLPGVWVFRPAGPRVAVEVGFRHPIALDGCASVFPEGALYLFRGREEVAIVDPLPSFVPVGSAVRGVFRIADTGVIEPGRCAGEDAIREVELPLRLAPTGERSRDVVATVVPSHLRTPLARLLYALPSGVLDGLSIAISERYVFLLDPRGIEGVPLGRFCSEVARRVYVPTGTRLVPAVAPDALESIVERSDDGHVFFLPGEAQPLVVAAEAFTPLSTRILAGVSARPVHVDAPPVHDPELTLFAYDSPRRFPLRGVADPDSDGGN